MKPSGDLKPHIYSVSELTTEIKSQLENRFPFLWLHGEISNFRMPVSGHYYFTLKDERAQISAVMFRGQISGLRFFPEDGMAIVGMGRLSVYEPRGSYQVIFEYLEPKGLGALQAAFEQLKRRLADEGLFDQKHKQPIPFLPERIGIITSPTGSVVHDILTVLSRRFPGISIDILPIKVQGNEAEREISEAIELLNSIGTADVAILARGGGSLEDLQPFNSERVARSIFRSRIPIISGVGHETDFTIADFVADLRAPTPSAAAEIAVPDRRELVRRCTNARSGLSAAILSRVRILRNQVDQFTQRLRDPRRILQDLRLEIDEMTSRMQRYTVTAYKRNRERYHWAAERLDLNNPEKKIKELNQNLYIIYNNLYKLMNNIIIKKKMVVREKNTHLNALNPLAVLKRGYSITRRIPDGQLVRSSFEVDVGEKLEVLLAKGILSVTVIDRDS